MGAYGYMYSHVDYGTKYYSFADKVCLIRDLWHTSVQQSPDCNFTSMAEILSLFPVVLILVSLVLIFRPEKIYKTWRKFGIFAIPISLFVLLVSPFDAPLGSGLAIRFDPELSSFFVSSVFLLVSIIIIVRAEFKRVHEARRDNK